MGEGVVLMRGRRGSTMKEAKHRAFTLVEILVVVIILGILAAIVSAQFVNATEDSEQRTTRYELNKLRRALDVYRARNGNTLPAVEEGDGTWGEIVGVDQSYLSAAPVNAWVGGENAMVISFGTVPDDAYHTDYGWIYDDTTGQIWAGAFDGDDQALPKP